MAIISLQKPVPTERKQETVVYEHIHVTFDCPACQWHGESVRLNKGDWGVDVTGEMRRAYWKKCPGCRSYLEFVVVDGGDAVLVLAEWQIDLNVALNATGEDN